MLLTLRIWLLRAAFAVASLFPSRGHIVLASASSSALRGNLSFVHDELVARGLQPRVKLLLWRSRGTIVGKLESLVQGIRAEWLLATSSVFIVDDYFFPLYVARPGQQTTVIQTWHASGAFKKVGYSVVGKEFGASEALVKRVDIHSNYDHCLIASKTALPHYMEAFGQPAECFVSLGIPRTDDLADRARREALGVEMREGLELPADRKVILYAPTFRGASTHVAGYGDFLDIGLLRERLGETHVLLVKMHPAVRASLAISDEHEDFAHDVSSIAEMNDLLTVADVLVTDYSSAIFDYALLERPMVFFAPDLEEYEVERGFYFDYRSSVPGPVVATTDEVASAIAAEAWDLDAVRHFRETSFEVADGHAAERFVDELVLPALS